MTTSLSDSAVQSKSQHAYAWISEKIRTREFEPGHRLVLSALADELQVSVVPVREAIRQLEAEGMVTYERNVGAKVTMHNRNAYFETMEIVATLEAAATALSAPHLGAEDLAAARELNRQMQQLDIATEPEEFTRLNQQFHEVLFEKCPNSRLMKLLREQWEQLNYHRVSTFRYIPQRARESVAEHAQLVDLIEAGADADYLSRKALEHRMATARSYRETTELHSTEPHSYE